jgi:hypothetical protein
MDASKIIQTMKYLARVFTYKQCLASSRFTVGMSSDEEFRSLAPAVASKLRHASVVSVDSEKIVIEWDCFVVTIERIVKRRRELWVISTDLSDECPWDF